MWYHHQWVSGIRRYWTDLYLVRSPNELFTLRRRAEQLRKNCSVTRGCGIESEWVDEFLYVCVSVCEQFFLNCSALLLKVNNSFGERTKYKSVQYLLIPLTHSLTHWWWYHILQVPGGWWRWCCLSRCWVRMAPRYHCPCTYTEYSDSVTDCRPQLRVSDQPDVCELRWVCVS